MEESSGDIYIKLVFCDFAYMVYVCVGEKLLFKPFTEAVPEY